MLERRTSVKKTCKVDGSLSVQVVVSREQKALYVKEKCPFVPRDRDFMHTSALRRRVCS